MRAATAAVTTGIRAGQLQRVAKSAHNSSLALARWQQQQQNQQTSLLASRCLHTYVVGGGGGSLDDRRRREQDEQRVNFQLSSLPLGGSRQVAQFHSTAPTENGVAIVLGLGAISALSYAGSSAVKAYGEYKASLPSEEEMEEERKQQEKEAGTQQEEQRQHDEAAQANSSDSAKSSKAESGGKRENVFASWFGVGVGAKYYEGGFEDEMSRKEAALILGVRESSPMTRIKDAHRNLLVLNHPDTGGSTYVAGKINEAKELLLKGKRRR